MLEELGWGDQVFIMLEMKFFCIFGYGVDVVAFVLHSFLQDVEGSFNLEEFVFIQGLKFL